VQTNRAFFGLVIAAVVTLDGCNSCADFNPFKDYDRVPADDDSGTPTDVVAGRFQLACYIDRAEDNEFAKKAVEQALRDSGGGSVSELSGAEREKAMRSYAQATGGAYWNAEAGGRSAVRLKLGAYKVTFTSPGLNLAADFDVEWTGGPDGQKNPLVLPTNTDTSHVTLLHNGGNDYELHFDGAKVPGNGLLVDATADKPRGMRRFDPLPFRLKFGSRGENGLVQAGEEIKIEAKSEEAEVLADPKLLIFEVKDFHGDMSSFLCGLLSRELSLQEDENVPVTVSFAMRETDVWLKADVRGGRANLVVKAEFTVFNAADRATSLKVEVAGLNAVSETTGTAEANQPTLTQRFDGVNLIFELSYPIEAGKRPGDDYVTFVYSIGGGPEQKDRVKHSLAGPE
jgi:hypothetical protein